MSRYLNLLVIITAIFGLSNVCHASDVPEHIVWNKSPLKIILPVGKERRIDFPVPVKVLAPRSIVSKSKRIQTSESGSIYWTAKESFESTRVEIHTLTGYTYLMDVEARKSQQIHPVIIVDSRVASTDDAARDNVSNFKNKYDYDYVDLARLASQEVYAPIRLIKKLPGITRLPVKHEKIPLVKEGGLIAEPIAQWQAATFPALFVTAVRITSNSLDEQPFNPYLIRGDFLSVTPQHRVVYPVGEEGSTTTWYFVSARPFAESAP